MSRYEIFDAVQDRTRPAQQLIVMPSILGGNLRDKADTTSVGDLGQRAEILSEITGLPVLALQRFTADDIKSRKHFLGLPKAYDVTEYTSVVATEAKIIAEKAEELGIGRIALVGVSAGAERGLAHAKAGLYYKNLFLFDPPAMQKSSAIGAFGRWAAYQAKVAFQDISGNPNMPNENRLPYKAQGEISAVQDMLAHRRVWTGSTTLESLTELAQGTMVGMENARTHLLLPEYSFTMPAKLVMGTVAELNLVANNAYTNFYARTTPMPHRVTDDPVRLALMVRRSQII